MLPSQLVTFILLLVCILLIYKTMVIVPNDRTYVVERLGKHHATLQPGLAVIIPFIDRVVSRHSSEETQVNIADQECVTQDNKGLIFQSVIYLQVIDPVKASYGANSSIFALTKLAQTALSLVISQMPLDSIHKDNKKIKYAVMNTLSDSADIWGVKVVDYQTQFTTKT